MKDFWSDVIGTSKNIFKVGFAGFLFKNNAGNVEIRNAGDTADAEVTASKVNVSGDVITLNSDAAESGADYKLNLKRPASGMTADVDITFPIGGTTGQVVAKKADGTWEYISAANTAICIKQNKVDLAFGTSSPLSMFDTGVDDEIDRIRVIVDTEFNGSAPNMSIGVAGSTSKYCATTDVNLKAVGIYDIHPGLTAQGVESLIATFNADGSTTGAARIIVDYSTPA